MKRLRVLMVAIVAMMSVSMWAGNPAENFCVGLDNFSADVAKATSMNQLQSLVQNADKYLLAAGLRDSDATYVLTATDKQKLDRSLSNFFVETAKVVSKTQGQAFNEELLQSLAHKSVQDSNTLQDVITNFSMGLFTALTGRTSF